MAVRMVDNLSSKLRDRKVASLTRNDLSYIESVRNNIGVSRGNRLLEEWSDRYDPDNIRAAKRSVRRMEESFHEGDSIHYVNPSRLDRVSVRMRKYLGVNPYTRKALKNQTLDIPHSDRLEQGHEKLSYNFAYRDMVSGISTEDIKVTHVYSDEDDYMDTEDRRVVLTSLNRIKKYINNNDE